MTRDEFEDQVEAAFARGGDETRARLARIAAGDPVLAERWDELEPAREALTGARLEPLPDGLHVSLIEIARTERVRAERRPGGSWLSFLTAAIQTRPAYALGGAVAAGIAIGALGFALIFGAASEGPGSARELASGTSASLPPAPHSVMAITLEMGDARAVLEARSAGDAFVVRMGDARGDASALTLTWDPAELELTDVRLNGASSAPLETGAGTARLTIPGSAGVELSLRPIAPGPGTVRASLSTPAGLKEDTLRLPR